MTKRRPDQSDRRMASWAGSQLSRVAGLVGGEPSVANIDGQAGRVSGNIRLSGHRWECGPDERPEASNPLWPQTGDGIEIGHFTARHGSDQNLTIGPSKDHRKAGQSLKRAYLHDGIISHGILHDGHPDDPDGTGYGHSHGCWVGAETFQLLVLRCIFAHNASRSLMHLGTNKGPVTGQAINCVVFNPMYQIFDLIGDSVDDGTRFNIINCLFKEGPNTVMSDDGSVAGMNPRPFRIGTGGHVHMSGCILDRRDGTRVDAQQFFLTQEERDAMPSEPFEFPQQPETIPAEDLYDILDGCGANGEYEQAIRDQVRNGTGAILEERPVSKGRPA